MKIYRLWNKERQMYVKVGYNKQTLNYNTRKYLDSFVVEKEDKFEVHEFFLQRVVPSSDPEYVMTYGEHDTCPRCGGKDTFWGGSRVEPDNDGAYFHMECEDCGKQYDSVMKPLYQGYQKEKDEKI